MKSIAIIFFVLAAYATLLSAQSFRPNNADEAEKLTKEFANLTSNSTCKDGQNACIKEQFAQCVNGKFKLFSCGNTLKCVVLPLVLQPGTTITCSTEADRLARLADARNNNN